MLFTDASKARMVAVVSVAFLSAKVRAFAKRKATLGLVCLLPLIGCGSGAGIVEKHLAELQNRLDAIDAAVTDIQAQPQLSETTLAYDGPTLRMRQDQPTGGVEDFDVGVIWLKAWSSFEVEDSHDNWWGTIRQFVDDPESANRKRKEHVQRDVKQFLGARYALFLKEISRRQPVAEDSEIELAVSFTPGVFVGEAHLFDLENEMSLGGFRFFASNSDNPFLFGDPQSALESNLAYEIVQAAEVRLFGLLGELEFENLDEVTADQAALMGIWHAVDGQQDDRQIRLRVTDERVHFEASRDNQTLGGVFSLPLDISGKYRLTPGDPNEIEFVDYEEHVWQGTYTIDGDELTIDVAPPGVDDADLGDGLREHFLKSQYRRPYTQ